MMDLYYHPASPACRIVQLTAKALNIDLNLKFMDVMVNEHHEPEFVKINPQHMIPTLVDSNVDGKFVLWESRAIASYLVEQYGKDHFLYPKDPKRKAIINQRLYFDMGTLYKSLCDYYYPIYFEGKKAEPEKFKKIEENFEVLEKLLDGQEYAAADHLTLADFSLIASITTFEPTGIDLKQYENVTRWITKCKQTIVGYEINQIGVNAFEALINPANQ